MLDVYYHESNIISILILLILFRNMRKTLEKTVTNNIFSVVILMTIVVFLCDSIAWFFNGNINYTNILIVVNVVYFVISGPIAFLWYCYVYITLKGYNEKIRKILIWISIPCTLVILLAFSTPVTGFLFYITETGSYQRGNLYFLQPLIIYSYLVSASLLALRQRNREIMMDKRHDFLSTSTFAIFPLLGGIIQTIFSINTVMPGMTLSILVIYLNLQNHQVSLDSLTGLNNRRQLDKYLDVKTTKTSQQSDLYLFLLDIDEFKEINDSYGHIVGDQAIAQAANVIKTVFGASNAFLARYGGDEFAVVLDCKEEQILLEYMKQIDIQLELINKKKQPYELHLSTGYAQFGKKTTYDVKHWLNMADRKMYECKKKNRIKKMGL